MRPDLISLASAEAPPRTVEAIAANELRAAIVSGALAPGAKIHQQATAARLGVSLIPLREALKTLAGEGIVTYHPQRGYFVAALRSDAVSHVYAARELVEAAVENEALPRVCDTDLEAMSSALRAQSRAVAERDAVEMIEANRRFHFTLFRRSENEWLLRFVAQLWDTLDPYRVLSYRRMWMDDAAADAPEAILREHGEILAALERGEHRGALRALAAHRRRSEVFITALTPPADAAQAPTRLVS